MTQRKFFVKDGKDSPMHSNLMLANIRALKRLGGSGVGKDILAFVIKDYDVSDEEQSLIQFGDHREEAKCRTKLDYWLGDARQRLKHSGVLEDPEKRPTWTLTNKGNEIKTLAEIEAL